jgi:MoaA/NifB/PqqE/SkfB family radical SAM enzyme
VPDLKVSHPWQQDSLRDLWSRFLPSRHAGWRKTTNLLAALLQGVILPDRAFARPVKLIIEPANLCNLSCPLCPTGRRLSDRDQDLLDFDLFRRAVDPLAPYLYEVYLYNWGEPLLNGRLFEMAGYCAARNIRTVVSSNLTRFEAPMMGPLFSSGLDTLIVSLDGASEESYTRYRRGGSFGQVSNNLRIIAREKEKLKAARPHLVWQFIVFRHNQTEMQKAAQMARDIGVDELRFIAPFSQMEEMPYTSAGQKDGALRDYLPDDRRYNRYRPGATGRQFKPLRCTYLWNQISVRSDGGVAPCCGAYYKRDDFGSLRREGIMEIWNNRSYRRARRAFRSDGAVPSGTICDSCIRNLLV